MPTSNATPAPFGSETLPPELNVPSLSIQMTLYVFVPPGPSVRVNVYVRVYASPSVTSSRS